MYAIFHMHDPTVEVIGAVALIVFTPVQERRLFRGSPCGCYVVAQPNSRGSLQRVPSPSPPRAARHALERPHQFWRNPATIEATGLRLDSLTPNGALKRISVERNAI